MKGMRVGIPLLLVAAFGLVAEPVPAVCAAASIRLPDHRVEPGDRFKVLGDAWFSGCQDSGSCSINACGESECDYGPEEKPYDDIKLTIQTDHRKVVVGEVDADSRFRFSAVVEAPPNLGPGRYRVIAEKGVTASSRLIVTDRD